MSATEYPELRACREDRDRLCRWCNTLGAAQVPVGHEHGSQRDPVRTRHSMCLECARLLVSGEWAPLVERWKPEPPRSGQFTAFIGSGT